MTNITNLKEMLEHPDSKVCMDIITDMLDIHPDDLRRDLALVAKANNIEVAHEFTLSDRYPEYGHHPIRDYTVSLTMLGLIIEDYYLRNTATTNLTMLEDNSIKPSMNSLALAERVYMPHERAIKLFIATAEKIGKPDLYITHTIVNANTRIAATCIELNEELTQVMLRHFSEANTIYLTKLLAFMGKVVKESIGRDLEFETTLGGMDRPTGTFYSLYELDADTKTLLESTLEINTYSVFDVNDYTTSIKTPKRLTGNVSKKIVYDPSFDIHSLNLPILKHLEIPRIKLVKARTKKEMEEVLRARRLKVYLDRNGLKEDTREELSIMMVTDPSYVRPKRSLFQDYYDVI